MNSISYFSLISLLLAGSLVAMRPERELPAPDWQKTAFFVRANDGLRKTFSNVFERTAYIRSDDYIGDAALETTELFSSPEFNKEQFWACAQFYAAVLHHQPDLVNSQHAILKGVLERYKTSVPANKVAGVNRMIRRLKRMNDNFHAAQTEEREDRQMEADYGFNEIAQEFKRHKAGEIAEHPLEK